MKKILPFNIEVFEFNDLRTEIKEKLICEQINNWVRNRKYNKEDKGNFEKAIDVANELKTPWFQQYYVYKDCKNEIIELFNNSGCLFDEYGNCYPIEYVIENNKITKILYYFSEKQSVEIKII